MSKRKSHNIKARLERSCRSLVRSNHVAVVNIDPSGRQGMINYKSIKNIAPGKIGQAVCQISHQWTIFLSAICVDEKGDRYIKSIEVAPKGMYLSDHLEDVIEHCYREVCASANPKHMIASGWIAIPDIVSLDDSQAFSIFQAVGAWNQVKVAA